MTVRNGSTALREGEVAVENACGHDVAIGNPAVPRPIYTDPEIASVGLTEAKARKQYGNMANGTFLCGANARAVMQNETDAGSGIQTVAGGIAPHPTPSEAINEAALVALGRSIHLPNRKRSVVQRDLSAFHESHIYSSQ